MRVEVGGFSLPLCTPTPHWTLIDIINPVLEGYQPYDMYQIHVKLGTLLNCYS